MRPAPLPRTVPGHRRPIRSAEPDSADALPRAAARSRWIRGRDDPGEEAGALGTGASLPVVPLHRGDDQPHHGGEHRHTSGCPRGRRVVSAPSDQARDRQVGPRARTARHTPPGLT